MDRSSKPETNSEVSKIAAVREAWLAAVQASDVHRLAKLWTDDVVIVHGNGRCVCGREAVKTDFQEGLRRFAIDQKVSSSEVLIREPWAFEISEVESVLTPLQGGPERRVHSRTVVVLARQSDASWKVCRVLGLLA